MTRTLTATDLKATILAVLDEVAGGEEVEVTKHGRLVARIVPARGRHSLKDKFAGHVELPEDDEDVFTSGAAWETA